MLGSRVPEDIAHDAIIAWLERLSQSEVVCSRSFIRGTVRRLVALEFRKRLRNRFHQDDATIAITSAHPILDESTILAVLMELPPSLRAWLDLDQDAGKANDAATRQRKCRAVRLIREIWRTHVTE